MADEPEDYAAQLAEVDAKLAELDARRDKLLLDREKVKEDGEDPGEAYRIISGQIMHLGGAGRAGLLRLQSALKGNLAEES